MCPGNTTLLSSNLITTLQKKSHTYSFLTSVVHCGNLLINNYKGQRERWCACPLLYHALQHTARSTHIRLRSPWFQGILSLNGFVHIFGEYFCSFKSAFCEQLHAPTAGLPTATAGHLDTTALYASAQLFFVSTASSSTQTDTFFPQVLSDVHFRWKKANSKPDKGSPLSDHPSV